MIEQMNRKKKFTPMTEQEILSSKRERQRISQAKKKKLEQRTKKRKVHSYDKERRSCPPKRETENQYEINN